MVFCVWHLPAGFPRHLRCPVATLGRKGPEAYCALVRLWAQDVEPTADALAVYFNWGRNKANGVLQLLTDLGYLHRWRRSAGRDRLLNFAVVTDEPFAWHTDDALAARMVHIEDQALAADRNRRRRGLDPFTPTPTEPVDSPMVTEPAPELSTGSVTSEDTVSTQVVSGASVSDTNPGATPKEISSQEIFTPNPRCGQPSRAGHVPEQPHEDRHEDRHAQRHPRGHYITTLIRGLSRDPELAPHLPAALAILHGLEFTHLERLRHARTVATALRQGHSEGDVIRYFTDSLGSARSVRAVLRYRLAQLPLSLASAAG